MLTRQPTMSKSHSSFGANTTAATSGNPSGSTLFGSTSITTPGFGATQSNTPSLFGGAKTAANSTFGGAAAANGSAGGFLSGGG